jgi:hypothetical protein
MIGEGLLQDATQMKLDVLSAMRLIAEPWRLITPATIKNCVEKFVFSNDHVSRNDSALELCEDEEGDWHSIHSLGVQFEDYTTCDSALEVCDVQSVDQMLDQHLTRPEEEPEEEEEVGDLKSTFLGTLKGLETAT